MLEYEKLMEQNIINKQQFLINFYHLINIDETELIIIILIQNMLDNNELVTTNAISAKMSINNSKVEEKLSKLVSDNILRFDNYSPRNTIDTSLVYQKIIDKLLEKEMIKEKSNNELDQANLIKTFEKEFKRKLSPFEIDTIKEWSSTFNYELVVFALKEAVMQGVLNFKYIEKIIVSQAKIING